MSFEHIKRQDPAVYASIMNELQRQRDYIELIASENFVSPAVMEAMGSPLTNKYAEGYPRARYYGGCRFVDEVEQLAIDRAIALFGAEHANVQPHSGSQANAAVYLALIKPGDTILGMDLSHGGHLTHGSRASFSGKLYHAEFYGVDKQSETIDYEAMARKAEEVKPALIIAGASAYPRFIDYKRMREIADSVGAYLMVDMAHVAGLVAAGEHPSPVPYAHVVTTTTHKTLRGPRGALILCVDELAKKIDSAVFPGSQGGPLEHIIAAKAVCFGEALTDEFRAYQRQTVLNARRDAGAPRAGQHHRQQEHDPLRPAGRQGDLRHAFRHAGRHDPRHEGGRDDRARRDDLPRRPRGRGRRRGRARRDARALRALPALSGAGLKTQMNRAGEDLRILPRFLHIHADSRSRPPFFIRFSLTGCTETRPARAEKPRKSDKNAPKRGKNVDRR